MSDRLAFIAFLVSCIAFAVIYGVYSVRWNTFPNPQIVRVEGTIRELGRHWRNDFGLEPTRHLIELPAPRAAEPFRMHRPEAGAHGFTLVAGLSDDQGPAVHAAILFDDQRREVYRWPVDYAMLEPDGKKPTSVMLHGLYPLPDGSLVAAFDAGRALGRIDACGRAMWALEGAFHHSVEADDEGMLWSWRNETIVRFDPETGEIDREIALRTEIVAGQHGVFSIHAAEEEHELRYQGDAFHSNDVEPLRAGMAAAFPMFEAGDLLISMRELNLVAVVDPDTGRLLWWQHGPWHRQHDPDWEPDGTISVYDNQMSLGASRILKIDPATREVTTVYEGTDAHPFYSYRRGKHQILPNGNVLVTESEAGRVFEATPRGALVWERDMAWDAGHNVIITSAQHLPQDFFAPGALACAATTSARP